MGGATGKGDGDNQDNTFGFKLSPAEAGDGQGAEGKGDCVGNGEPVGFEPSPADAGKKKGGEGQGDGERQGNPTGFEPSPADITHTPNIELLRAMMVLARGCGLCPSPFLPRDLAEPPSAQPC